MKYEKEFKKDDQNLKKLLKSKAKEIKAAKNKNMSASCRAEQSIWTRRVVQNIRLPQWLVNKAIIKGSLLGGIARYIEELIVKDLGVEEIREDLYGIDEE